MVEWKPFGQKAQQFITTPINKHKKIILLTGAVRSSKTVAMIPKFLQYLNEGPPGLFLFGGVSKQTIYDNVLRDLFDTIGENNYEYKEQKGQLRIYDRECIVKGAKDDGAEKFIRGLTLAGFYLDEGSLTPTNFFNMLTTRISVPGAHGFVTTNPGSPNHDLYTDWIINEKKNDIFERWQFMLEDNPTLEASYVDYLKKAYAGVFYKRMILGQWVQAEGAIYDMFTDDNTYEELPFRDNCFNISRHYITCDYGTQNATVFLHIMDDGKNLWVDDEYYHSGRKAAKDAGEGKGETTGIFQKTDKLYVDELERFIFKVSRGGEKRPLVTVDPTAASFKAEINIRPTLGGAHNGDNESVVDGIHCVQTLFNLGVIKVNKLKCPNLIREIGGYCWDDRAYKNTGEEKPIKIDDHAVDALRIFTKKYYNLQRIRML